MAITMDDIAEALNVSKSTVSRALNDSPQISERTKIRIRAYAESRGYHFIPTDRSTAPERTPTITVILPTGPGRRGRISEPFTMEMVGAIADELLDRNINMLLTKLSFEQPNLVESLLATGPSEGFIIIGQRNYRETLCEIAKTIPNMVVWGARHAGQNYCTVGGDNHDGGMRATQHLIDLGCRRIAYFGSTLYTEPMQRLAGYKTALEAAGIPYDEDLVVEMPFDRFSAYSESLSWLQQKIKFDAVFACSDVIAMSAITALREKRIAVPRDVAVVGYDDIPGAEYYHPSITTIRQNIADGSSMLVEKLLRLSAGHSVRPTIVKDQLIVRASCGSQLAARGNSGNPAAARI